MKFLNHDVFIETINQWVRDGSNIQEMVTVPFGEFVTLKGRDGLTERLSYYSEESEGYLSDDSPNGDDSLPVKSNFKLAVEKIYDSSQQLRIKLLDNFRREPGMLATFGEDFDLEMGDVDLVTDDLRHIDAFDLQIRQNMRFTRRKEADVTASPEGDSGGAEA